MTRPVTIPEAAPTTERVRGADLRVGDVIEVWWPPKRDVITALVPYTGALAYLFKHGAQLATFAICRGGMTIDNGDVYERAARSAI